MHNRLKKTYAPIAVVAAIAAALGASAFTASNTVPAHSAGSGAASVSGYTVSSVAYTYSADGTKVNEVDFALDRVASDVKIALTATPVHNDWQDCTVVGNAASGWGAQCVMSNPVAVGSATSLSVIAVSTGTATIAP